MSIEVKEVTKLYGTQKALDAVSFSVKTGEIVGFLGPNGAGKSTLMKIITCYLPQNSGKVSVCGFDVESQSIDVRKNVGYLPESNPLYYDMYVKEYLLFMAGIHALPDAHNQVEEMITRVGLTIEKKKKIGQLSKGYKQRVGLAQALLHNPQVLILDEPTTGLDPNQLAEIRELIRQAGKTKTVLLSTHIMQEVEAICDRVIIINKGRIVADSPASELKNLTGEKQIVHIEFDSPLPVETLRGIEGIVHVQKTGPASYTLQCNTSKDIRATLFRFAVEKNVSILTLQKEAQSMENVFKQLTK